jgi:hypothetical protein
VIRPKAEKCPTCGGSGFRHAAAPPRPRSEAGGKPTGLGKQESGEVSDRFAEMTRAVERARAAVEADAADAAALALGAAILRLDERGVLVRHDPPGMDGRIARSIREQFSMIIPELCVGYKAIAGKLGMSDVTFDALVESNCRRIHGSGGRVAF